MTVKEFATKRKLKVKSLAGEPIIPCEGSAGRAILISSSTDWGNFGAMLFATAKICGNARRQCLAAGCKLWQHGDPILLDPMGQTQVTRSLNGLGSISGDNRQRNSSPPPRETGPNVGEMPRTRSKPFYRGALVA